MDGDRKSLQGLVVLFAPIHVLFEGLLGSEEPLPGEVFGFLV
jgi:hypothetical protein